MALNTIAPNMAVTAAGAANFSSTLQLVYSKIKPALNKLFARCTNAVAAIASLISRKMARTGIRSVPSPKPEKKVINAVPNDDKHMMIKAVVEFMAVI